MKRLVACAIFALLIPFAAADGDWLQVEANSLLVPTLSPLNWDESERVAGESGTSGARCIAGEFDVRPAEGGFKFGEDQATSGCGSFWTNITVPDHASTLAVHFAASRSFETEGKWEAPNFEQVVALYQGGQKIAEYPMFGLQSEPTNAPLPKVAAFPVTPGPATVEWWFADGGVGAPMIGDIALPASGYAYKSDVVGIRMVFAGLDIQVDRQGSTDLLGGVAVKSGDTRKLTVPEMPGDYQPQIKIQFPASKNFESVATPRGQLLDASNWPTKTEHGVTFVEVPADAMVVPGTYQLLFQSSTQFVYNAGMMVYTIGFALVLGGVAAWTGTSFRRVGPTLAEHSSPMFRYAILASTALFLLGIGVIIWVTARAGWSTFAATPVSVEVLLTTVYMGSAIFALIILRQLMVASYHTGVKQFELETSNRDLDQFSHIVTHDLRAPLRSVSAFTGLLRRKYDKVLDEEALEYIELAQGGAARMSKLLDAIGEYARVGRGQREFHVVSLTELVDDVKKDLHVDLKESGARIVASGLPALSCDPALLREALLNLVQNAVKFKHPKRRPVIQIRGHKGPLGALITVQDNGLGMEDSVAKSIFEPFQRVQATDGVEGTGMGLAICRRIAERHGGHIDVESTPGKGTTFILHLPNA